MFQWRATSILAIWVAVCVSGCTSMTIHHSRPIVIGLDEHVVVFPFYNLTEAPQADERAAAIVTNLLRAKGLVCIDAYPIQPIKPSLIPGTRPNVPRARLLQFARRHHADLALSGSVNEWSYKAGLDGEPVVGINLEMIDVNTGQVIWSAVGSKSGGSRVAASEVAIVLAKHMLSSVSRQ